MAVWTTPITWANGPVTAGTFNQDISENMRWLKAALSKLNVTSETAKASITPGLVGASISVQNFTVPLYDTANSAIVFDTVDWDSLTRDPEDGINHNGWAVLGDGVGYFNLSDPTREDPGKSYWLVTIRVRWDAMTAGHRWTIIQHTNTVAYVLAPGIAAVSGQSVGALVEEDSDAFTIGIAGQSGEAEGIDIDARMVAHRLSVEA